MPLLRSPDTAASLQPLTLPLLTDLLKSDELEVTTETDVLTSIALWLLGDLPQRAQHAGPLLATVRAFFAEAECRGAVFAASAALNPSPTLVEVDSVIRAMAAHAPDAALRNSPQWSLGISHRLGSPTQLMVAGGVGDGWRTQKGTELYDPRTDTWIAGPRMPVACNFAAACTLGRRTMVVEGAAHSPSVVAFDRHAKRWETLPRMQTARVNMAAAAVPEAAYVLGGRVGTGRAGVSLKTVEVYDEGAGVWKEVAEMTVPRASLAASALNGKIYAIGGQSDRQTHASLEYYDPGADVWCAAARTMARPRKYAGVGAVGGQLIIVGGMTAARARLPYAEAYDPREGLWRSLPGPMVRSSCGVAVLQGELYVAGGSVEGDQVYDGVDCFSLAAGAWRPCAPLSGGGRTGLALAPV